MNSDDNVAVMLTKPLSGTKASQVCSNVFAAYIPCKRGVWTVRRRGLSRSCRPQELEPLPLTSV